MTTDNADSVVDSERLLEEDESPSPQELFNRESLERLETPFTWWTSNSACPRRTQDEFLRILTEKRENQDGRKAQWQIAIVNLSLAHEYWKLGEIYKARLVLDECDEMLVATEGDEDHFLVLNHDALKYIILSSRFYLAGDDKERREILQAITKLQDLGDHMVAGIHGVRAAVYMEYGYKGTCNAIEHLRTAIRMDPEAAEWHFLYGKAIGRRRHVENAHECLTVEELKSLETAVELSASKNPYYVLFLAQAYREAASNLRRERDPLIVQQVEKMNDRAYQLYEHILRLRPDCPHINVRCAQGYLRFLASHRDTERAYQCCQVAVLTAPNNIMINHVWGQVNERLGHVDIALAALEKAATLGAYGAYMDWIRLKRNVDPRYDPLGDLESMLSLYQDAPYQRSTLAQLASYYYFVLQDASKAVRCLIGVVHSDPMSDKLRSHYPITFAAKRIMNLYAVLIAEADLTMEAGGEAVYFQIITLCQEHFPEVLQTDNSVILSWYRNQAKKCAARGTQNFQQLSSRSDADKNWRKAEAMPPSSVPLLEVVTLWERTPLGVAAAEKRPPDVRLDRSCGMRDGARKSWRGGDGGAAGEPRGKYLSWRDKSAGGGLGSGMAQDMSMLGGGDCRPPVVGGKKQGIGEEAKRGGFFKRPLAEKLQPCKKGMFFPDFSS